MAVRKQKLADTNTEELSAVGNADESGLNEADRDSRIAVAAYYKALARGFEPGNELSDWLAAEAEERT